MLSSTDLKVRGYVRYDIDVDLTWLKNNWLKNLIYLKLIKRLYHNPPDFDTFIEHVLYYTDKQ